MAIEYYKSFDTSAFLSAVVILKKIPVFYTKVYFCSNHLEALWHGDKDETFSTVSLVCNSEDIQSLKQVIKNNFLYRKELDSTTYTNEDYGFSFVIGKIKFTVMPALFNENNINIKYYDVESGKGKNININGTKEMFFLTNINENGNVIRTCDFSLDSCNESNSTEIVIKKEEVNNTVLLNDSRGYAITDFYIIMFVIMLSFLVVAMTIFISSHFN